MWLRLLGLVLVTLLLAGVGESAETLGSKDTSKEKEKAAAEEAAHRKEQADEEAKYRRETDQKQIEIQQNIAEFTRQLVIIGYLQVLVAGVGLGGIVIAWRAANAANDNVKVARQTLVLANRPRIKIRAVSVDNDVFASGGRPITIHYELVNYGQTDATLVSSDYQIWLHAEDEDDWPMLPPYNVPSREIDKPRKIFSAGESLRYGATRYVSESQKERFSTGVYRVYLLGFITYQGEVGSQHHTAFCRKLTVSHVGHDTIHEISPIKFIPVEDSDYEYED